METPAETPACCHLAVWPLLFTTGPAGFYQATDWSSVGGGSTSGLTSFCGCHMASRTLLDKTEPLFRTPCTSEVECEAGPLTSAPEGNESPASGTAGTPLYTNGFGWVPFKGFSCSRRTDLQHCSLGKMCDSVMASEYDPGCQTPLPRLCPPVCIQPQSKLSKMKCGESLFFYHLQQIAVSSFMCGSKVVRPFGEIDKVLTCILSHSLRRRAAHLFPALWKMREVLFCAAL